MIEDADNWLRGGVSDPADAFISMQEEYDRRVDDAVQKIAEGYKELCSIFGEYEAHDQFTKFVKVSKPPRRPKGKHDPAFDKAILAAYTPGQSLAPIYAIGKAHHKEQEATRRHLRRLLQQEQQRCQVIAAWRQARMSDK